MPTLYFVRHGQASFGKEDYDQLSDLGYEQARVTGQYLSKFTQPTVFVSGTLKRQRQTLKQLKLGFSHDVVANAQFLELEAFNEFDHRNILEVVYPDIREKHKDMLENLLTSKVAFDNFQIMYKAALQKWVNNDGDFKESFHQFNQRICDGFVNVMSTANDQQDIVLVSSAGPISTCMQHGCDISAEAAFWMCEQMVNTGVSAIKKHEGQAAKLSFFNSFQHLIFSETDVTYR